MRHFKLLFLGVLSLCLLMASGCGSGGKDVAGTLTLSSPTISNFDTFCRVSVTITYTGPAGSNVGGLELNVATTYLGGIFVNSVETLNDNGTNSAGITLTYTVPRDAVDQPFRIAVATGSLHASTTAIIPRLGAPVAPLTLTPTSVTFTPTAVIGDTIPVVISGGAEPYGVQLINPSPNPNIGASITGTTLTITKKSLATGGSASVLVIDSTSPPNFATLTVNY